MPDPNDVAAAPSPAPDVNPGESSNPEPVVPESTPEVVEAPPQVEQSVPYDRFRQVNEEKKQLLEIVQGMSKRQQAGETIQQVEDDPYKGMTPEEQVFYRNMDTRVQKMIHKEAQKLAQPLVQQNQALASKVTQLMEKDFRSTNKDVQPNSQEEQRIASLINQGINPDDAAWAVMGPKRVEAAKNVKTQQVKQTNQIKAAANLETRSIPATSPIPKKTPDSFRSALDTKMKEAGL